MKHSKKVLSYLLVFALAMALFSGCAQQRMSKIVLAVDVKTSTLLGGIYAALDKGIYKAAGIELEIIETGAGEAAAMARDGKAHFATSTQEQLAYLLDDEEPANLTAVSALIAKNPVGILTQESRLVYSLKELKGKTCAFTGSPSQTAMLREALRHEGITDPDITFIDASNEKINPSKQFSQGVYGIIASQFELVDDLPHDTNGEGRSPFFNFTSINPEQSFYGPVLVANDSFLKEKEDVARAFVHSTAAGYNYGSEQPEDLAKLVLKYHPDENPNHILESQKQVCKLYRASRKSGGKERWGYVNMEQWNAYFAFLYRYNLISENFENVGYTSKYLN